MTAWAVVSTLTNPPSASKGRRLATLGNLLGRIPCFLPFEG